MKQYVIRQGKLISQLTQDQRNRRSNIRNAYLIADLCNMQQAKQSYDTFEQACLQEMIETCIEQNVDNFGKTV